MDTDSWAIIVSVISVVIAAVAVFYARMQAGAAHREAHAAELQVTVAKEQADAAREQAESAKRQVAIGEKARRDSAQPYVYADIRPDTRSGVMLMLVIENTGPTIARNVRVQFDPPLESVAFDEIATTPALIEGIKSMPPGRRQEWFFDSALERYREDVNLPRRYHVTVNAYGPFGAVEELEYDLDLNDFLNVEGRGSADLKDVVKAIDKIAKQLGKR